MGRKPNRFSTRVWLDEALKSKNIDAVEEMVQLYKTANDDSTKLRILENIWDRLYPKARPEDSDGNPEEGVQLFTGPIADEKVIELINQARGKK